MRVNFWKKLLSDFLIGMWPYIIIIDIKKIFSLWGSQHGGWKMFLQDVLCIYMPGCVISRCQIYNCSSLFVRLWPGACEWATFAGFMCSLHKGFYFIAVSTARVKLHCIWSLPCTEAGSQKVQPQRRQLGGGGSEKERRLTLEFPTSAVSPETGRYMASGINIAYSVPPIKLFKFIAYFPIPSNI